jgi:hypothetical protein
MKNTLFRQNGQTQLCDGRIQSELEAGGPYTLFPDENLVTF